MEIKSPPPCPPTVTIRRNPPRKARATPSSAIPLRHPLSSPSPPPLIFDLPQNPKSTESGTTENLKVYLRIRPPTVSKSSKNAKNAWPKNPKTNHSKHKLKKIGEMCVQVNDDTRSVTVSTPQSLQETKRIKSEVFEGFSRVFGFEASQIDVFEEMVKPLVDDFIKGKSGMLAAMGPSGSGKTHTVFGCGREPGMVPLALRRIFSEDEVGGTNSSRVYYLSMFEISSEKGKAERMIDLLQDGGDICLQNSVLKGHYEAVVCDAQQAESLIARGMLKRATATTNSNSQSSRSQCIINIRCDSGKDDEVDGKPSSSMLTIVDLAGAEREKKTGNQGTRLLESNFINNTSMVFGLCLRSLLEHQKNKNKLLQKHYKNSLLTRYLRDYLEGKKRMMLILTVKPGVEDYLDTSFLLRQASPFTKIKYKTLEEPVNLASNKRPHQALAPAEQLKKMKFSESEEPLIGEGNTDRSLLLMRKEIAGKVATDCLNLNVEDISDKNLNEVPVSSDGFVELGITEKSSLREGYSKLNAEKNREYRIMQGLSRALLTVLKEYKTKLKVVETENCYLGESLINEKTRTRDLEDELANEKKRLFDMKNELVELKSQCGCWREVSSGTCPISLQDASFPISQYQMAEMKEVNSEILSYSLEQLERTENAKRNDHSDRDSVVTSASFSGGFDNYPQKFEDLLERNDATEDATGLKDTCSVDMLSRSLEFSTSITNTENSTSYEDKGIDDISSRKEATSPFSSADPCTGYESEQDIVKNLEAANECVSKGSSHASSECESAKVSQDYEDLEGAKEEPTQLDNDATDDRLSLVEEEIVSVAADETVPVAADSHIIIKSSESTQKDDIHFHGDEEQLNKEEHKVDPMVIVLPKERRDAKSIDRFVLKDASCSNIQRLEKPKRRLLPASSVLLKDISILDIKDENDKPKGAKGGKRVHMDDKNRTKGSLSLLNLLSSKLDR